MRIGVLFFIFFFLLYSCSSSLPLNSRSGTLNPLQFGFNDAKTGEERYYVLQRTHKEAERLGVGVSYVGIDEIKLVIPKGAKPLPITHYTDFAGVTIQVENQQKNMFLYSLSADIKPVDVTGEEIDSRDFSKNETLKSGVKLLIVNDSTPWVENRPGHSYGYTRKEIMLLKKGKSGNDPVLSYRTTTSKPIGFYCDISNSRKTVFKNVTFTRTANSTAITYLVKIENHYDIELSNITINTPDGTGLYGDRAIRIINCLKISMADVKINGTYSQPKDAAYGTKYGYGISLDNTYDFYAYNLYARAHWGVFGNNNVHKATLEKCDINRFDIHCYGRDISFVDCNFVDLYNSFGSVYGLLSYKNCTFTNCKPLLIDDTYNTYVGNDVYFENCTFNLNKKKNSIIYFRGYIVAENPRPELKEKCLPNVTMINCRVNVTSDMKAWYIYNTDKVANGEDGIGYLSDVIITGLITNDENVRKEAFSRLIKITKMSKKNNISTIKQ